ncbi:MAG: hypothetical protein OEU87_06485 [Nitrospira sp.]|nr:hypothetical protein [Nitrospira sp.]
MENEDNTIDELLGEISGLITLYPKAIERQAAIIQATGKDQDLVDKLVKAADTMRDSGNLYLTWAKHYAAMAKGNTDATSDEDETEDFDV